MEFRIALGMAVRDARVARGWSQDDLAGAADTDRAYIGGIERGRRNPTLATLDRLSAALGVPMSELVAAAEATTTLGDAHLRVADTRSGDRPTGRRPPRAR